MRSFLNLKYKGNPLPRFANLLLSQHTPNLKSVLNLGYPQQKQNLL